MTRNERIIEAVDCIAGRLSSKSRWVRVTVDPAHTTEARFTTLDPRDENYIDTLLNNIRRECQPKNGRASRE